jgi:16S rRNA (adenine1518-N6/adenine1519-N6)-dimethyltransferase
MGQSFLLDQGALRAMAAALAGAAAAAGTVFEIGCGPGNLTEALLDQGLRVIALERDRRLGRLCRRRLANRRGLTVILGDALRIPLKRVQSAPMAVAGNLPYSITGEVLRLLADDMAFARTAGIVIQEEVARRILSPPGLKTYGALTVLMDPIWHVERGIRIPASSFYPRPRVDSRHLMLRRRIPPAAEPELMPLLRILVTRAFSFRRKKMRSALPLILRDLGHGAVDAGEAGRRAGIDLDLRPEALEPGAFISLARAVRRMT